MPGKYVYLFELDSVRCSDREIIAGQKALYDEIVLNGNIVVLSYNQFIEFRAFFSFLSETDPVRKKYGEDLMKLIGAGRICVSQYGDCRSVSQYLINTVDRDSEYIYSGLPIKSSQKRLIALMKRCLVYSDLSELSDLIEGKRSTEDLRDLFTECVRDDTGKVTGYPSKMSTDTMKENLCQLRNVLMDVLRMGLFEHIYIAPRSTEEVDQLRLDKLIRIISRLDIQDASFRRATEILKRMVSFRQHSNSRSDYLKELKDTEGERLDRQYLEALIDLLYNYVCEYSICNTAKRYDVSELTGDID